MAPETVDFGILDLTDLCFQYGTLRAQSLINYWEALSWLYPQNTLPAHLFFCFYNGYTCVCNHRVADVKPMSDSAKTLLERAHALENEAETRDLYRDWAKTYDQTMLEGLGYESPAKASKLLSLQLHDKNACILDVGTGTGLVGRELAALGYTHIDGIDYSAEMLLEAKQTGVYRQLFEADLTQPLELPDQSYAALICIGTFTHGHVDAQCLDELFRLIKPGGLFVTVIRKTYWQPAGFAAKVAQLTDAGVMDTLVKQEDSNYADSSEVESWFLVWRKKS